jgi:hypothetical protein
MGVRNTATFFAGSYPVDLSGADVTLTDCIGLRIDAGGNLHFQAYDDSVDTWVVSDGEIIPGMFKKIFTDSTCDGVHALR